MRELYVMSFTQFLRSLFFKVSMFIIKITHSYYKSKCQMFSSHYLCRGFGDTARQNLSLSRAVRAGIRIDSACNFRLF